MQLPPLEFLTEGEAWETPRFALLLGAVLILVDNVVLYYVVTRYVDVAILVGAFLIVPAVSLAVLIIALYNLGG